MSRVIAYIDGFNLYFGLRAEGWKRYYWLNVQLLMQKLLKDDQVLVKTKYFTSRITYPKSKEKRQSTYIEALETLQDLKIYYGQYRLKSYDCYKCKKENKAITEKMTDVKISVEMLVDAYQDKYDTALLVTGDSDLVPVINAIKKLFPLKRIVVVFPPKRYTAELAQKFHAHIVLRRTTIAQSLFPDEVKKPDGFVLKKPESWKKHSKRKLNTKRNK